MEEKQAANNTEAMGVRSDTAKSSKETAFPAELARIMIPCLITSLVTALGVGYFMTEMAKSDMREEVSQAISESLQPPIYMVDSEASVAMMLRAIKMGDTPEAAGRRYSTFLLGAMETVRSAGGYVLESGSVVVGPATNVIGMDYLKRQDELSIKEGNLTLFGYPKDDKGKLQIRTLSENEEKLFTPEGMRIQEEQRIGNAFDQAIEASKSVRGFSPPSTATLQDPRIAKETANALRGIVE